MGNSNSSATDADGFTPYSHPVDDDEILFKMTVNNDSTKFSRLLLAVVEAHGHVVATSPPSEKHPLFWVKSTPELTEKVTNGFIDSIPVAPQIYRAPGDRIMMLPEEMTIIQLYVKVRQLQEQGVHVTACSAPSDVGRQRFILSTANSEAKAK